MSKLTGPRVLVLSLGGTIAMTQGGTKGVVPTLRAEDLVAAVPGLSALATIEAESFRQIPGAHLQIDDLDALARAISVAIDRGVSGVVVTQGTDTIEETAFALDRLLGSDTPVVVTGAMRNPTVAGADGPGNLLAAVQTCLSPLARGLGCLVVMNDEIHAARFVRKMHTSNPAAFMSPQNGPIGWITEGEVGIAVRPSPVAAIQLAAQPARARVALLTMALGDDDTLIQAVRQADFDGLVIEAMGGGHVAPAVADALEAAAAEMPVILATRIGAGPTLARTYGFTGGEIDLQRRGLIRAGWLDGLKAKMLLTLLIRNGATEQSAMGVAFTAWGGG